MSSKSPTARHIPLFSNIPGYEHAASYDQEAGYDIKSTPSNPEKAPASPQRPQTADATLGRKRSKIAPSRPSFEPPLPWSEKPLPLAVNVDRKRSGSEKSDGPRKQSSETIERPKTSTGTTERSALAGKRNQSDTSLSRKHSGPTYSLTPSVSHSDSRRASQASKATIAKSTSSASNGSGSRPHQRSGSATSAQSSAMVRNRPPGRKEKEDDRTILDEVEGTLSATITELQELNAVWHTHSPPVPEIHPAFREANKASPVFASTPTQQNGTDYFTVKSHKRSSSTGQAPVSASTLSTSQSLPPTPLNASHPKRLSSEQSRLQEIQAAFESQKRKAFTLAEENEQLREQLCFALKKISETDAIRNERDKFERDFKDTRSKHEAIVEELSVANVTVEVTENRLHAVEARLEEANEQKVDVLEHNNDLQEQMVAMQKQIAGLSKEISELRTRPDQATINAVRRQSIEIQARNHALEEQIRAKGGRTDLASIVADLKFRLDDADRVKKEKDSQIAELGSTIAKLQDELKQKRESYQNMTALSQQAQQKLMSETQQSTIRITELQGKVSGAEKERRTAQAERDKFEQLLLAEFRRTAIEIHGRQHPAEPLLAKKMDVDGAVAQIRQKAELALKEGAEKSKPSYDGADYDDEEKKIRDLEREVEYYLKDIVLYKLDVKGYKKDLRKAQARIQELEHRARLNGCPEVDRDKRSGSGTPSTPPQQMGEQTLRTPLQYHQLVQPLTKEQEAEQRPSISSQSSSSTGPGMSMGSTGTEGSPETPRAELGVAVALKVPATGKGNVAPHGLETYQPRGSPVKRRPGAGLNMI